MEKIKFFVFLAIGFVFVILVYSLSKSWFFFQDFSVKVNEPLQKGSTVIVKEQSHDYLLENSKILWKNYLFYPSELVREAGGFGPEEIMNHAKNITFVNLQTNQYRKLFKSTVYILDYFSGEFTKKNLKNPEIKGETLDIENRLLIFAMSEDTNKDGFLNQKDLIKVFLYNPFEEKLYGILPEKYYFQKLLFGSKRNQLVCIIKKEDSKQKSESMVFTYDTVKKKGTIIKEE